MLSEVLEFVLICYSNTRRQTEAKCVASLTLIITKPHVSAPPFIDTETKMLRGSGTLCQRHRASALVSAPLGK